VLVRELVAQSSDLLSQRRRRYLELHAQLAELHRRRLDHRIAIALQGAAWQPELQADLFSGEHGRVEQRAPSLHFGG
jgi:hypothetical protein